jgi:maltooligosyltrehalose synthase
VDFQTRAEQLDAPAVLLRDLARDWRDGRIKQALTQRFLGLRRQFADLFQRGAYIPLEVLGEHANHVIAFARAGQGQDLVVVIGRHFAALTADGTQWPTGWHGTVALPATARYVDALDAADGTFAESAELSHLFSSLPLSVLRRV